MAENWVTRSIRKVDEGNYSITGVRGYNVEAVKYVQENTGMLKSRYKPETVIAVSGRKKKIVAYGRTMEGVLEKFGGLEKVEFPNTEHVMVGKTKDILLAKRRFAKHIDFLRMLDWVQGKGFRVWA